MSRGSFSTTIRLETTEQPVLTYPFTVSIHFQASSIGSFPVLWALSNTGVTTDYVGIYIDNPSSKVGISIGTVAASSSGPLSTTAVALNTDAVATAVFASPTDRRVFLNGAGKNTDTTSIQMPAGLNLHQVGALRKTSVASALLGRVAHLGIWNEALSDAEVAQLGLKVDPRKVRPDRLIRYHLLDRRQTSAPEPDALGGGKSFLPVGVVPVLPQPPVVMSPAFGVDRRLSATMALSLQLSGTIELCGAITTTGGVPDASANPGAFFSVL